jgi:hypothetical protein
MPLQTSGAISLNDIHVEAGGSSGTTATINDSDIRGLISKASGATMSFSEWYGASAAYFTSSMYVGTFKFSPYGANHYGWSTGVYSGSGGALNPASSSNFQSGANIIQLNWTAYTLRLRIDSTATNSGWSYLNIGSTSFARSNATFNSTQKDWTWYAPSNPIGTSGSKSISIT